MGLRNMYSHSQTCNPNIKRDMLVQKIYMENEYFRLVAGTWVVLIKVLQSDIDPPVTSCQSQGLQPSP